MGPAKFNTYKWTFLLWHINQEGKYEIRISSGLFDLASLDNSLKASDLMFSVWLIKWLENWASCAKRQSWHSLWCCLDICLGRLEFAAVRKCMCRMQWRTSKLNDWEPTGSRQRGDDSCHHCKTRKYRNWVLVSCYGVSNLSCVWMCTGLNMYRFKYVQVWMCTGLNMYRFECVQVCICTGLNMHRFEYVQVWICTGLNMYRFECVQVWICTGLNMYRFECVQVWICRGLNMYRFECVEFWKCTRLNEVR